MKEFISEFISESSESCLFFGACSVSEFDLLSDVFRQQLACFMYFAFWNVVFACRMMLVNVVFTVCWQVV